MLHIRTAHKRDVRGIMAVETETFGPVGEGAAASEHLMHHRINTLTTRGQNWFLVAESAGRICAYMILQPTNITPENCTSWHQATADGTLEGTYDPHGKNIYVVSLAAVASAPMGASDLLMHASLVHWMRHGGYFMFCSRMPGYARANARHAIRPEDYMRTMRASGGPRDPMLRLYWEMSGGVEPHKVLINGFLPDTDSGGHGALFVLEDSARALLASAQFLYRSAYNEGRKRETAHANTK